MKWIKPQESLPDDNVEVIVYIEGVTGNGALLRFTTIAHRIGSWSVAEGDLGQSYWDIELTGIDNRVLAWMPLPEYVE